MYTVTTLYSTNELLVVVTGGVVVVVVRVCRYVLSHVCEHVCAWYIRTSIDFPEDGSSFWPIEKNCKLLIIFRKIVIKY